MGAFVYRNQKMYTPNENSINLMKEKTDNFSVNDNTLSFNCNNVSVSNVSKVTLSNNRSIDLSISDINRDYNTPIEYGTDNWVNFPGHEDTILYSMKFADNVYTNIPSPVSDNHSSKNAFVNITHSGYGPEMSISGQRSWLGSGVTITQNIISNFGLNGINFSVINESVSVEGGNRLTTRVYIHNMMNISIQKYNNPDNTNNSYYLHYVSHSQFGHNITSTYYDRINSSMSKSEMNINQSRYAVNVANNTSGGIILLQNSNTFSINIATKVSGSNQYAKFVVNNTGPYWIYPNNTIKCLI